MIRFTLKCSDGHQFESWFQSAAAYDALKQAGHVECAVCGSAEVEKAIMAPRVSTARKSEVQERPLDKPASEAEQALAKIKAHVEANSDYVGMEFASEARAMHDGDAPERAIYGEAKPEDAKKLIEDGVPVTPLPFLPGRKVN